LLEQMGGSGIHFGEVEADFRLTPSSMTLLRASAIGPSMGISMDGVYDVKNSSLDMRGVISPLYLLNGIGSIFTRKGEGLSGFNYNLNGPTSAPKVSVNPLSALTPGLFREIFRAPAPLPPQIEQGEVANGDQLNVFAGEDQNVATPTAQETETQERAKRREQDLAAPDPSDR